MHGPDISWLGKLLDCVGPDTIKVRDQKGGTPRGRKGAGETSGKTVV